MYIYVLYIYILWMVAKSCNTKRMVFHPNYWDVDHLPTGAGFRKTIHQLRQAGKDVKENLKNWAKQQEAELAEDGHGDNYALRKLVINMDQLLLDNWYPL